MRARVVFAPSYSIYSLQPEDLESWLSSSDVTALNAQEDEFVRNLGLGRFLDDAAKINVTTLGSKGARIREASETHEIPSYSSLGGDVVGAGDAFLAGYLDKHIDGKSAQIAGRYGALAADELVGSESTLPFLNATRLNERLRAALARER